MLDLIKPAFMVEYYWCWNVNLFVAIFASVCWTMAIPGSNCGYRIGAYWRVPD